MTRRLVGIIVERRKVTNVRFEGGVACTYNPIDCCPDTEADPPGDRDVTSTCPALAGYTFPRRLYLTVLNQAADGNPAGCDGCQGLFAETHAMDYDAAAQIGLICGPHPGWICDVSNDPDDGCRIWVGLLLEGFGSDPDDCFTVCGFLHGVTPPGVADILEGGGTHTLTVHSLDPLYLEQVNTDDGAMCAGRYIITE